MQLAIVSKERICFVKERVIWRNKGSTEVDELEPLKSCLLPADQCLVETRGNKN